MATPGLRQYCNEVEERSARCTTIPSLRQAFRKKYSFSASSFEEQLNIWDHVWRSSPSWKARTQAFFYCETQAIKEKNIPHAWKILRTWQDHVNDWGFCDSLSKIFTKHLEVEEKEVYDQLVKWNSDKDLWKRRQSIVSLLYYARTKDKHLPYNKIQPLIHNLLDDEAYYVQKGVGWALRELYNVYPEKTFTYLQRSIKGISAIAFSAATEKLTAREKTLLKSLRK